MPPRRPASSIPIRAEPGWIVHAGLARTRPGGTPTVESLLRACALGASAIEVDVCVTADRRPVLRHDITLETGVDVDAVTLAELRRIHPETLTVDEGLDLLDGHATLLDVKTIGAAHALGRTLDRRGGDTITVCSEVTAALVVLQRRAPRTPRWLALPDVGISRRQGVAAVVRTLARQPRRRVVMSAASGLARAAWLARQSRLDALARIAEIPWRAWLPDGVAPLARSVGASGVCLQHWLVNAEVVAACHDAGLPVAGWTVNTLPDLGRVVDAGVDLITSDRVAELRSLGRALAETAPQRA